MCLVCWSCRRLPFHQVLFFKQMRKDENSVALIPLNHSLAKNKFQLSYSSKHLRCVIQRLLKAIQHGDLWLKLGMVDSLLVSRLNSLQWIWCTDLISQEEMYLPGKGTMGDNSRRKGRFVNEGEVLSWLESWERVAFTESDPKHSLA